MSRLHFIGIKGSGMASLASICHDLGYEVTGSDVDTFLFTEVPLIEKGIKITSFDAKNIVDGLEVVIGSAFDDTNIEVATVMANNTVKYTYYYEFLSKLMNQYCSISVAGSHGKTTTTGMVQALLGSIKPTGYLIGDGHGFMAKAADYFVVESCEYKDHFHFYFPKYAIITNIDLDHVDYFKSMQQYVDSFQKFINQVSHGVVLNGDDQFVRNLDVHGLKHITYGLNNDNDVTCTNIETVNHHTEFDLIYLGENHGKVIINAMGNHNVSNALSAISLALLLEFDIDQIKHGISTFNGVARRFNVEVNDKYVYIDDYAHHPTEIKVTIEAARKSYPNRKVVVIYKPDRVSRIRYFEKQFSEALLTADAAYVLDFPQTAYREDPFYSLQSFLNAMGNKITYLTNDKEGAKKLACENEAVYLFVSPKDIYKFKDLLKEIQKTS